MTPTKIIYNNFDFGNQPTPFLSSQENFIKYGENFGSEEFYTLNGQLTGNNFNELRLEQLKLLSGFSQDFGTFIVKDLQPNEKEVLVRSGIKVESINFPQNKYTKVLDYNINFSAYPTHYFNENYGIINPSEVWSFDEGDDGIMSVSHSISAQGIETPQLGSYEKSSSFQNAVNYVKQRTGSTQNFIPPHFICKSSDYSLNLESVQETIDRIGGIYSVTENYSSDLYGNSGILRYSANINSSVESSTEISIEGRVEGNRNDLISITRDRFLSYDWFSVANDFLNKQLGSASINIEPLEKNITEDLFNNNINFSYRFSDKESAEKVKTNLTTTISSGTSTVSVSVNGSITSSADKSIRSGIIQNAFDDLKIFDIANGELNSFFEGNPPKPLNNRVIEESFSRQSSSFQIDFSQTFDDKDRPEEDFFKEVQTSLTFTPSRIKLSSSPLPDKGGLYDTIDLETKTRASLNISLNAVYETGISNSMDDLIAVLKDKSNKILTQYGRLQSLNLESLSLNTGSPESISLDSVYTFESPNNLFLAPSYSTINELKV